MNWNSIKGISTIKDFSEYFMENGPIHKAKLFIKPDREELGYLWDVSPEYIMGIERNVGESLNGILITNDLDARVVQGLFNTVFYKMASPALLSGVKTFLERPDPRNKKPSKEEKNKMIWEYYREILTTMYENDYTPIKKYLSQPVVNRIWIPLFPEYAHMDKLARKGYYQFLKWIIGNETIILELPSKYEVSWIWEAIILGDGPMINPEAKLLEEFSVEYPGSIKHIPDKIVDKIGVQPLEDLDFFGITFI